MNYRKAYLKIILKAKSENKMKYFDIYYEAHHILPKSLFPNWAKRKSNIVLLTAREHFFCHQLLDKIYPGRQMFLALWWLANDGQNNYCVKGSREYEKLRERRSKDVSDYYKDKKVKEAHKEATKKGLRKPEVWGKFLINNRIASQNPIKRKKLSEKNKGKKQSKETIEKRVQKLKGRSWYTDGTKSFFVHKEEAEIRGLIHKKITSNGHERKIRCVESGQVFPSAKIASIELGLNNPTSGCFIGSVANGKYKSAYGYHWEWA